LRERRKRKTEKRKDKEQIADKKIERHRQRKREGRRANESKESGLPLNKLRDTQRYGKARYVHFFQKKRQEFAIRVSEA